jgi:hypothetical protein
MFVIRDRNGAFGQLMYNEKIYFDKNEICSYFGNAASVSNFRLKIILQHYNDVISFAGMHNTLNQKDNVILLKPTVTKFHKNKK